ncbi:MAG: hypothetical protein J6C00_00960 [Eubacterium sp.]|nr:hypothetical protein [Eubacterium sp.]
MSGLLRSLKYATFRAGRVIGICLLMAVAFVFYFAFLNGDAFSVQNLIPRFPFMLLVVGNLMFMIYGMLDVATYTQLTLTYGCTRKNAAISTVYMHLLQIAAIELVMALCCVWIPRAWMEVSGGALCLLSLGLFLFGSGLALTVGILIHRFGKIAYIIVVIIASLCGGVVGGVVGARGGSGGLLALVFSWLNLKVLLLIGVIWYAVMALAYWFFIRKIEVRV